jgi:hypothetical protein
MLEAADETATGAPVTFRVDFPSVKFVPIRICVGLIIVYGELAFSRRHGHSKAMSSAQKVVPGMVNHFQMKIAL